MGGSKTSLERIQNGMEEEELDTGSLHNTFPKNLLDKIAETGSIIWNGIRKKRVFPHLDSSKMSRITICKIVEIIL